MQFCFKNQAKRQMVTFSNFCPAPIHRFDALKEHIYFKDNFKSCINLLHSLIPGSITIHKF